MKKVLGVMFVTMFMLTSCTENERAKQFGGTMTVNIAEGDKLVEATWKDTQLRYLTRPRREED